MSKYIDTDRISETYRRRSIDVLKRQLLLTKFQGSEQEKDFTIPANCGGFGRIHHFRRQTSTGWPSNPIPIDPICKALGLPSCDEIQVQVFQNAVCNWRCWYCFVDFKLLSGNSKYSEWMTPEQIVQLYFNENNRPSSIDLSGGQPDLNPEWVPWMMEALQASGLDREVYLWSDDNLSNDFFWKYLGERDREFIVSYKNYGRVCCFKGFNADSFAFNTRARPELFERQFELMARLLSTGIDLYAYATFTCPAESALRDEMERFVDRLQVLNVNLPLRTVPLEIRAFGPMVDRVTDETRRAEQIQWKAIEEWSRILEQRFSSQLRATPVCDVKL